MLVWTVRKRRENQKAEEQGETEREEKWSVWEPMRSERTWLRINSDRWFTSVTRVPSQDAEYLFQRETFLHKIAGKRAEKSDRSRKWESYCRKWLLCQNTTEYYHYRRRCCWCLLRIKCAKCRKMINVMKKITTRKKYYKWNKSKIYRDI